MTAGRKPWRQRQPPSPPESSNCFFFLLKEKILLCSPVWPGTQNIDLAGLKFAAIFLLLLLSAGMIGTYIITPGLFQGFLTAGPGYLCVSFYHMCGGGPTKAFILFCAGHPASPGVWGGAVYVE